MEQQLQAGGVTCILTSCGRFDLLKITLDSFLKYNTYDIADFFIYEDSGLPLPQGFKDDYPFIKWLHGAAWAGQINALDVFDSSKPLRVRGRGYTGGDFYINLHVKFKRT